MYVDCIVVKFFSFFFSWIWNHSRKEKKWFLNILLQLFCWAFYKTSWLTRGKQESLLCQLQPNILSQVTDVKVKNFFWIYIVRFVCRRSGQQQKKSQPLNLFLRKGRKDLFRQWKAKRVDLWQFKFDFRLKFFNLGWFSVFFVFWGKETKGIKSQPRLKQNYPEIKFDLWQILTCLRQMFSSVFLSICCLFSLILQ